MQLKSQNVSTVRVRITSLRYSIWHAYSFIVYVYTHGTTCGLRWYYGINKICMVQYMFAYTRKLITTTCITIGEIRYSHILWPSAQKLHIVIERSPLRLNPLPWIRTSNESERKILIRNYFDCHAQKILHMHWSHGLCWRTGAFIVISIM